MEALLNALASPSAFVDDFRHSKLLLPFIVVFIVILLAMILRAPLALDLTAKQSNLFTVIGVREYVMYYVLGMGGQIIGLLVKWSFATFFLGTILQFATPSQSKMPENGEEIPAIGYSGLLQLVAYSGMILAFEALIKEFAIIIKNYQHGVVSLKDLDVSIGLSLLVERANVGAFIYAFLGEINLITLWGYGVLAYWIVSIYRIRRGVALSAVGGLWLVCTLLVASVQAFSANMTGAAR